MEKKYRKCAGIIVVNPEGKVLLCARKDGKKAEWQFPQGGIEDGETPEAAARRELLEETSVSSVDFILSLPSPLRYDFPPAIREKFFKRHIYNYGQEMYWSLFRFTGADSEINLQTAQPEFRDWGWFDIDDAPQKIVFFKKHVYEQAVRFFKPYLAAKNNVESEAEL